MASCYVIIYKNMISPLGLLGSDILSDSSVLAAQSGAREPEGCGIL